MTTAAKQKFPSVKFTIAEPVRIAQQCLNAQDDAWRVKNFKDHKTGDTEVILLIEPNSDLHKALKAAALEAAQLAFPGTDVSTLQMPFKNGTTFADKMKAKADADPKKKPMEWFRGFAFLKATASALYPPKLADSRDPMVPQGDGTLDFPPSNKFYAGAYTYAEISFKGYTGQEQTREKNKDGEMENVSREYKGVTAYMNSLLFAKDAPKLGFATRSMADVFKGVVGQKTQVDPMDTEEKY